MIGTSKQYFVFLQETCNLDELICLHALQNRQPVESFHSMGPNDNADLILWIMKLVLEFYLMQLCTCLFYFFFNFGYSFSFINLAHAFFISDCYCTLSFDA